MFNGKVSSSHFAVSEFKDKEILLLLYLFVVALIVKKGTKRREKKKPVCLR